MENVEEELHRDATASPPWNRRNAGRVPGSVFLSTGKNSKKFRA